ncbi:LysR family transcriptional regulator [Phenylobacterium sp.]|jgi:DNA-binding transcriptional LysR family regulator|uniref:LysR family transcriptional regulator n=1 Tax=Phenylobacterium sp. TaxID=1871053 RepID=UPI002E30898A|nr:LysR family transcriptional regulator [Phenylobacterium sp.]HEX3366711.1 LysR family transcriptional regulator [Phenylobacterium sp.]
MDRLEAMSVLLEAVDAGTLSAAGRRLGAPLATVSRRIADLEAHLKTRLLVRGSRRLTLTDAGRAYVAAARLILEQMQEAERAAAGEYNAPRGDLTVSAPVVFGRLHVLPVANDFLAAYPEIGLRLVLSDRAADLTEERIDAAIRFGVLPDSGLVARRLGAVRQVVCASPAYLAAHGTPATPAALRDHACVTFEGLSSPTAWRFAADVMAPVRSRLIVSTAEAAIDAAIAGAGLTRVLSYQVAEAVGAGALALVLRGAEPDPWPVHLIHAQQGLMPQKLRAFLDFAGERLRDRLSRAAV